VADRPLAGRYHQEQAEVYSGYYTEAASVYQAINLESK
jgi:hypothetical protein